jgi:hypothetical protein
MKPLEFPEQTVKIAENQEEYQTLPAFVDKQQTISLWGLSLRERIKILITGKLWLTQLNFSQSLQPQLPEVRSPFLDPED